MKLSLLVLVSFLIMSSFAHAGETMFGYIYTAETIPKGQWEYEQIQTVRMAKAQGGYTAVDMRNEIEYGVTDAFQAAFYLNSSYIRTFDSYDPEDVSMPVSAKNQYNIDGVSLEFIYRLLSPYKDAFGFALYLEPELKIRDNMTGDDTMEKAVETRLIFQKNFFDDQLIVASNIMAEPEWEVNGAGEYIKELWMEFTLGATYRFAPKWYAGVELRNHMEFIDMNLANQEHSAFFAGPSVHYGSQNFWAQLTVLPQVWGWPRHLGHSHDGREISSNYAHLGQHEKTEVRLKFGIPF